MAAYNLEIKEYGKIHRIKKKITKTYQKIKRYLMGDVKSLSLASSFAEDDISLFSYLFNSTPHIDRHTESALFREYYNGEQDILEDKRRKQTDEGEFRYRIMVNHCAIIVNAAVDILRSKEPTLEGQNLQEEYSNRIDSCIDMAICQEASITGNAWILIYRDENQEIRYMTIADEEVWDIWDPTTSKLIKVVRKYNYTDLNNISHTFVDVYDENEIRFYIDAEPETEEEKITGNNFNADNDTLDFIVDPNRPTIKHGFGYLPIIHIPNTKRLETDLYGISDLAGIKSIQDAINGHESDESDVLRYHGFPQMVIQSVSGIVSTIATALEEEYTSQAAVEQTGFERLSKISTGVQQAIFLRDPEAKVYYVPRELPSEAFSQKRKKLVAILYSITSTPLIDSEQLAGDISGSALKMQYRPAEIKAAKKATRYSDKFKNIYNKVGIPCEKVIFNFNIPVNETDAINRIMQRLELGMWDLQEALEKDPGSTNIKRLKDRLMQRQEDLCEYYEIDLKKLGMSNILLDKKTLNSLITLKQQREAEQRLENEQNKEVKTNLRDAKKQRKQEEM